MSYCRFRNTAAALEDCLSAEATSDEERAAKERLIELCQRIASERREGIRVDTSKNIHTAEIRTEDRRCALRVTLEGGGQIDVPRGQEIKVEQVWCGP